jgi:hypothetical protein
MFVYANLKYFLNHLLKDKKLWKELIRTEAVLAETCVGVFFIRPVPDATFAIIFLPKPQLDPLYTPQPISLQSILIPSSHQSLGVSSGLSPSGFPTKSPYTFLSCPMRATCPINVILLDLTWVVLAGRILKCLAIQLLRTVLVQWVTWFPARCVGLPHSESICGSLHHAEAAASQPSCVHQRTCNEVADMTDAFRDSFCVVWVAVQCCNIDDTAPWGRTSATGRKPQ